MNSDSPAWGVPPESEANARTVMRVFDEVVNQGRLSVIDDIYTDDVVDHEPLPGAPSGRDGVRHSIGGFLEGLPDLHVEVHAVSAHGDHVVVHNSWRGTHDGLLAGLPPTGRAVDVPGVIVWRLRDGRISERWAVGLESGLMRQLGVSPLITKGLDRRRRRPPSSHSSRPTSSPSAVSDPGIADRATPDNEREVTP